MMSAIRKESIHLYVIQFANYVVPIISLPYLTKVLTLDGVGRLGLAQAVFVLAQALIDFGFTYTAGRDVSLNLDDKKELSSIYTNVQFLRFLIFLILVIISSLILYFIDFNSDDKLLYFLAIISSGAVVLMPLWVFNGLSKNSVFSQYLIFFKIITLFLLFLFVKSVEDYLIAFLILNSSMIFLGIPIYLYLKKNNIEYDLKVINFKAIKLYFNNGFNVFIGTFLSMTYTNFIPFFIKFFTNDYWVGVYIVVERLMSVLKQMYMPIIQASYGKICQYFEQDNKFAYRSIVKKISFIFLGVSVIAFLGNIFLGEYVIYYLLNNEQVAYKYTFMSMFISFIVSISIILTYCFFLARGLGRNLKWIYIVASLFFSSILYFMATKTVVTLENIYIAIFLVETSVVVMQLLFLYFYNRFLRNKVN